jgi:putative membrane protein
MGEAREPVIEPSTRTELALERTRAAGERTLMAWTRTAVSLVSFGFSIPKLFRYLQEERMIGAVGGGPFTLGLMLIALGTLSLVAGMLQHVALLRRISGDARGALRSVSLVTAMCMVGFGVYAFTNILSRH